MKNIKTLNIKTLREYVNVAFLRQEFRESLELYIFLYNNTSIWLEYEYDLDI